MYNNQKGTKDPGSHLLSNIHLLRPSSTFMLPSFVLFLSMPLRFGTPSHSVSSRIRAVQHFGLKMAFKSWTAPYQQLLSQSHIHSLSHRRSKFKMILLFKVKEGLYFTRGVRNDAIIPYTFLKNPNNPNNLQKSTNNKENPSDNLQLIQKSKQ